MLCVHKGLFTNSAKFLLPADAAAEVSLPAVHHGPADNVTTLGAPQFILQLCHLHQTIIRDDVSFVQTL